MANFILKGSGFYKNDSREEDKRAAQARRIAANYAQEELEGKKHECTDLTPGQRQYLARKGIKGREFDNMTPRAQREWMKEMKEAHYAKNDKRLGTVNRRFEY